uniref:Uncharacterized protein n=1 Tax=Levilactobacillus brevis TaxID=1580 RepID=D7PVF5_LEVBR|nr:hypothetical protein [Levilactobacillus brevis]
MHPSLGLDFEVGPVGLLPQVSEDLTGADGLFLLQFLDDMEISLRCCGDVLVTKSVADIGNRHLLIQQNGR